MKWIEVRVLAIAVNRGIILDMTNSSIKMEKCIHEHR